MAKARYGYGWLLKFILAAILLGVGIYMALAPDVVYLITGVSILLFSLLRIYPLVKTLKKEVLRTLNIVEVLLDAIIGVALILIAIYKADELSGDNVWSIIFRYSLVIFFYARGLVFFHSIVFFGEKTEIPKFWVHIVAISLGAVLIVSPDFSVATVGIIFLIIALIGAIYLGFDGFNGYKKYREFQLELNEGKAKETVKTKNRGKSLPGTEKKPVIEEPEEDQPRPYVN